MCEPSPTPTPPPTLPDLNLPCSEFCWALLRTSMDTTFEEMRRENAALTVDVPLPSDDDRRGEDTEVTL